MFIFSFLYNDDSIILEIINVEFKEKGVYTVHFNKKRIGTFVIQDDGYFGFYTEDNSGYWSSYALRLVADSLDEFNKEWDTYLTENLKSKVVSSE